MCIRDRPPPASPRHVDYGDEEPVAEGSEPSGAVHMVMDVPRSLELIILSFDDEEELEPEEEDEPEVDGEDQAFIDQLEQELLQEGFEEEPQEGGQE